MMVGSKCNLPHELTMPTADQLLAKLYALRKDYADDPEDETYLALHHAFMFISYQIGAFKEYVEAEREKLAKSGE